jgi:DegV family protein with EDD domain|tara:strand:- start:204 stop:1046 length:843 start_codon:yes stop_codon:yes gene_type:complete
MAIRIVTDSTSDIPKNIAETHGITVVPLNVHFGETVFKDGIDLTTEDFFEKLVADPRHPSTSQPSVGEFVDTYRDIASDGDEIISIHITSKLSGTYNSATQAANQLKDKIKVHVIDTEQVSCAIAYAAIAASNSIKNGGSVADAISAAKSVCQRSHFYALFDTLEYLAKGGRIGKAQSLLGGLLKVKPILRTKDGVIDTFKRARSRKGGMLLLNQTIKALGSLDDLCVIYSTDNSDAQILATQLTEFLPDGKTPLMIKVGPVIGTHAGPNLIGVGCIVSD